MTADLLSSLGLGVLLGSIPAAWLLVRLVTRRDVSREGSGNVGALNALRVSRSRSLGVSVMVLDGLKGAAAAWCPVALGWTVDEGAWAQVLATLGAIAGHNFNPWLSLLARRWVGGKGFAAATGAALVFAPWMVVAWVGVGVLSWLVLRKVRGITDEAPASALATVALIPAGALVLGLPGVALGVGMTLLVMPRLLPEALGILRGRA